MASFTGTTSLSNFIPDLPDLSSVSNYNSLDYGMKTSDTPIYNTDSFGNIGTYYDYNYNNALVQQLDNAEIQLSDNVKLRLNKNNLIIIKKCNIAISWDNYSNKFETYYIEDFSGDFENYKFKEKDKKEKNEKDKVRPNYYSYSKLYLDTTLLDLLDTDENIYIDLKNKKIYQYSEDSQEWNRKVYSEFKLSFYRKFKFGEFKNRKNSKILLVEKLSNDDKCSYIPNYIYNELNTNQFILGNSNIFNDNWNNYINNNITIGYQAGTYTTNTTTTDLVVGSI